MGFTTTLQQQEVSKNKGLRGLNYSHSIVAPKHHLWKPLLRLCFRVPFL